MDFSTSGSAHGQREEIRRGVNTLEDRLDRLERRLNEQLGVPATESAVELAEEEGVDLADVYPGSGPGGRVWKDDVQAALGDGD